MKTTEELEKEIEMLKKELLAIYVNQKKKYVHEQNWQLERSMAQSYPLASSLYVSSNYFN